MSGYTNQLLFSIMHLKLDHILKVKVMMEMHTSMLFLKVKNWNGLLEWMESSDVIGKKLHAYRQACKAAYESQIPFVKLWAKYTKYDDDYEKYMRDIDAYTHMIARITMNGFVQIHLMWNKEALLDHDIKYRKKKIPASGTSNTNAVAVVPNGSGSGSIIGGVFWTKEVEAMTKMRMGLIMHAIEILS